jgi:hypothetical protein
MKTRHHGKTSFYRLGLLIFLLFSLALTANPVQGDVLWNQPLSTVSQQPYVNQNFTGLPAYNSYLADDFTNINPWNISKIFVPGDMWNGGSTLGNATSLTFSIYGDNLGKPNGYPGSGSGPQWSISLVPTDGQIALSPGTGGYLSNVTLSLTTPVTLLPGAWWLVFYPDMNYSSYGQYGRQPSDTQNSSFGLFINPGDGFGYGTAWQDWAVLGMDQWDIAFRLEGTTGGQTTIPEPSTMLLIGCGLLGLAGLRRKLKQ